MVSVTEPVLGVSPCDLAGASVPAPFRVAQSIVSPGSHASAMVRPSSRCRHLGRASALSFSPMPSFSEAINVTR
jgi:hypothetical protein